jgi:imidazolonepropionase
MTNPHLAFINVRQILTMAGPPRPRVGPELRELGLIEDGAVLIRDGKILATGATGAILRDFSPQEFRVIDLRDRPVVMLPGFVDSHTHPAFWGTREDEYELRILGASYEEIATKGGGILNSARRVQRATVDEIRANVLHYSRMFLEHGTTTIEAKSGYGLSFESELKLLRAIAAVRADTPLDFVPTFLGAHAYPVEFRQNHRGYLDQIIGRMLPAVAAERLARYVDVFCDRGFFSVEEAREIIDAAGRLGLKARIHADELAAVGAAELAAEVGAVSADHLEKISPRGIKALAARGVIAGLLPGTAFNLGLEHYPPARKLIDAGVPVALATDFNPGTCFTPNMQLVVAIACAQMRLTPAEALVAATINGAWALELGHDRGSLESGKRADIAVMNCANYRQIPYLFGVNHCVETIVQGRPLRGLAFAGA